MDPEDNNVRASVVEAIAEAICSLRLSHPPRVAVDGRTASGKTAFADELAIALERFGRSVIRASIDGFHRPKAVRYRQGRLSPDGYYEDARDLGGVRRLLLDPLGPNGDGLYTLSTFDLEEDKPLEPEQLRAAAAAVLVVDGTFLQRPELRSEWDFVAFLDVPEDEARRRGIERDAPNLGDQESTFVLYDRRYGPAFARYLTECNPRACADVVIDNAVLKSPSLRWLA